MALTAKEKQKAYRMRQRAKKVRVAKIQKKQGRPTDAETNAWTECRRILDDEILGVRNCASYGPDGFKFVGQSCYVIKDDVLARKAFARTELAS